MANQHIPEQHALESYFGKLDDFQTKMMAQDRFAHETYNLPDAFKGKNQYLQEVLNYMITGEADFYMDLLPWVETDDLSIQWEIFTFNKTLFDLEPNQAVPRYVTAEREARSDRLVRRGLGFIIEHGFYTTEQGRRHYLMNLRQITDAVTETAAHGVVIALLGAHQHYAQWIAEHGPRALRNSDLLTRSRNMWGIVQKQERGLYVLDADIKDLMRYQGVTPDTILFPSRMGMYVSLVPGSETEYYRKGPGAIANLETGPATFQTFRGLQVHESRPFDVDFIGQPYDLLVRERQIGDYFLVPVNADKFYIYSMDTDKFVDIKGKVDTAAAARGNLGDTGDHYLVARPFRTYHMASAIYLKRGLETGMTAHGHHDFQLSDDTLRKIHIGHYTFWHKSVVKQPKNICIAEDIFARGYVQGEGHEFFVGDELKDHISSGGQDSAKSLVLLGKVKPDDVKNPIDVSGRYPGAAYADGPAEVQDVNGLGGATNGDYAQLQRISGGNQTINQFNSPLRALNTVCFRGMSIQTDAAGKNRKVTLSTDHWGVNVYQGCKAARTGGMAFLKDMGYERGDFDKIPLA